MENRTGSTEFPYTPFLPFTVSPLTSCITVCHCYDQTNIAALLLLTNVHSLHQGSLFLLYGSVGFDKCVMFCIQHYSILQSSFTALKISCVPPLHPSPTCPPEILTTTDIFIAIIVLAFPECHIVGIV